MTTPFQAEAGPKGLEPSLPFHGLKPVLFHVDLIALGDLSEQALMRFQSAAGAEPPFILSFCGTTKVVP